MVTQSARVPCFSAAAGLLLQDPLEHASHHLTLGRCQGVDDGDQRRAPGSAHASRGSTSVRRETHRHRPAIASGASPGESGANQSVDEANSAGMGQAQHAGEELHRLVGPGVQRGNGSGLAPGLRIPVDCGAHLVSAYRHERANDVGEMLSIPGRRA
jgi:hypothetical protein